MIKAITRQEVESVLTDPSEESLVDAIIHHVNVSLSSKNYVKRCLTDGRYIVGYDCYRLSQEECMQVVDAFRAAGWASVVVASHAKEVRVLLDVKPGAPDWAINFRGERIDLIYGNDAHSAAFA